MAITRHARVGLDIIWHWDCKKSLHSPIEKAHASVSHDLFLEMHVKIINGHHNEHLSITSSALNNTTSMSLKCMETIPL